MLRQLTRLNYHGGMFLGVQDFEIQHQYFDDRLRLHNRISIGTRIIEGLQVCWEEDTLVVSPGLAFDCLGRELIVSEPLAIERKDGRYEDGYILITRDEVEAEFVPILGNATENTESRLVVESVRAFVGLEDFVEGHQAADNRWVACNNDHALPLATLKDNKVEALSMQIV